MDDDDGAPKTTISSRNPQVNDLNLLRKQVGLALLEKRLRMELWWDGIASIFGSLADPDIFLEGVAWVEETSADR